MFVNVLDLPFCQTLWQKPPMKICLHTMSRQSEMVN